LDIPPVVGTDPRTDEELVREADPEAPFSGLVFKIQADPHVGKLAYLRVYSGKLDSGSYALNSSKGDRERIGRLLRMHANHREEAQSVAAGDIVAIIGLKNSFTGAPLCHPSNTHPLAPLKLPGAVVYG